MSVSVIIPTYYRRKELAELLNSLLRQTYKPSEIIIVDDTPTYEIANLCEEFSMKLAKEKIELIYCKNPKKKSSSIARNVGVEKSSGDILLFLDSDVVLFQDYIENIMHVFNKYPNALAVQGWIVNLRRGKFYYLRQVFYKIFFMSHHAQNRCRLFEYPSVLTEISECQALHGSNFAVKRNVFNEIRFDEKLLGTAYMEDLLFSYTLFRKHPHSLFITPYAKCIHKISEAGREKGDKAEKHKSACRLYVLTKLFGFKGKLLYIWQNVGHTILKFFKRLIKYSS
ncbi:MAG: glycosyltransferase [Candidatus Bathyarchaeia archaeon]